MIAPTAADVHARLLTALAALQKAEQNAVLLFAEVLQRKLFVELGLFQSLSAAITQFRCQFSEYLPKIVQSAYFKSMRILTPWIT